MRSIWAVVVACLVAVAGVRPIERAAHDRNHDRGARLVAANAARAVLARRDRDHRPELQLPAATLPELAVAAPPRVAIDLVLHAARVAWVSGPRTPRSSRGPPRA
jgi:predicted RNase H-like nuclease